MRRFLLFLVFLALLGVAGLVGYAYVGDLAPTITTREAPAPGIGFKS